MSEVFSLEEVAWKWIFGFCCCIQWILLQLKYRRCISVYIFEWRLWRFVSSISILFNSLGSMFIGLIGINDEMNLTRLDIAGVICVLSSPVPHKTFNLKSMTPRWRCWRRIWFWHESDDRPSRGRIGSWIEMTTYSLSTFCRSLSKFKSKAQRRDCIEIWRWFKFTPPPAPCSALMMYRGQRRDVAVVDRRQSMTVEWRIELEARWLLLTIAGCRSPIRKRCCIDGWLNCRDFIHSWRWCHGWM